MRSLSLGSGSGGWVTEAYSEAFSSGLQNMSLLTTFSLKYDCTDELLKTLTETCSKTLTSLDIERCGHITDESALSIVKCTRLKELNMFRTGLSDEGLCQILCGLRNTLVYLPRGDFLCDVLDELDDKLDKSVKFKIVDFWASEDYYFHHGVQMERAARRCPNITKMLFMFQV